MNAARIYAYGEPTEIRVENIEKPTPHVDQVLVKVHAASLNPFDLKLLAGNFKNDIQLDFPITLGGDFAGVVTQVDSNVSNLKPGDKVYGQAHVVSGGSGAFADYATALPAQLAMMPHGISFAEAASLPLVGVSALQAITEHIRLSAGQYIYIHGGSGGIGSIAIQLAKHIGAIVTTTTTGEGIDYVKRLGATKVIDYRCEDIVDEANTYDAVLDTVGGPDFTRLIGIVRPGGVAVSMVGPLDVKPAETADISAIVQSTSITTPKLEKLAQLVENEVILPSIDASYPLEKAAEAFQSKASGTIRGKLVITITHES